MCDACHFKNTRWAGWNDVPAPVIGGVGGPWLDLSHTLTEDLSAIPNYPRPTFEKWRKIPDYPANITLMNMVVHHGTHLDAPNHFIDDAPSFDQVPLHRLYGPGVVWSFPCTEYGFIDVPDLESARPLVQPGDIVLFDTGWAPKMRTPAYERHPSLTPEAAQWLLDHRVKMIGVDFATPDRAPTNRPEGFYWPVHHTLLPHGVLIAEHVNNLAALSNRRIEAFFTGLSIIGSDGGPVRAIARAVD
ncbi:cyclase family protein [Devosia sp.]|uniref:cyclase family protein n=1 Tax=Devosia sp. TaxID=1871048 RepID=UPI002AFEF184|nr:cyclase family protein [Devosia sp.]